MNFGGILNGIGAGLGQAAQNYQQQRDAQMRNLMLSLYLKNQQKQSDAAAAAGQLNLGDLLGGNKAPGLPGGLPIGQATSPDGGMPAMPIGPAGPSPTIPPPAPGPDGDSGVSLIPGRQTYAPPGSNAGMSVTGPPGSGVGTSIPPVPTSTQIGNSAPITSEELPALPAAAAPQQAAGPAAANAPQPGDSAPPQALAQAAAQPDAGAMVAHLPGGGDIPIGDLVGQRISLSDIQKSIRQQMPGLDPETAWLATEKVFKLVNQDNAQNRLYGLGVLKELGVITGLGLRQQQVASTIQHQRAGEATASGNLAARQRGLAQGDERIKQGDRRIGIANERLNQQSQQFKQRMAQADQSRDAANQRAAYNAILRDIEKQLFPGLGAQQPSDEERTELMRQKAEVVGKLWALSGKSPAPSAAPATPAPGG